MIFDRRDIPSYWLDLFHNQTFQVVNIIVSPGCTEPVIGVAVMVAVLNQTRFLLVNRMGAIS